MPHFLIAGNSCWGKLVNIQPDGRMFAKFLHQILQVKITHISSHTEKKIYRCVSSYTSKEFIYIIMLMFYTNKNKLWYENSYLISGDLIMFRTSAYHYCSCINYLHVYFYSCVNLPNPLQIAYLASTKPMLYPNTMPFLWFICGGAQVTSNCVDDRDRTSILAGGPLGRSGLVIATRSSLGELQPASPAAITLRKYLVAGCSPLTSAVWTLLSTSVGSHQPVTIKTDQNTYSTVRWWLWCPGNLRVATV